MTGTTFSVTAAILCTPPRKMNAAMAATMTPTTIRFTPNALWNASPIELDCTMLPIKPSARIISTEKTVASTLPPLPLNAARI